MSLTCNALFWTPLRGQNFVFCSESKIYIDLLVKWMGCLTVIQALTFLPFLATGSVPWPKQGLGHTK